MYDARAPRGEDAMRRTTTIATLVSVLLAAVLAVPSTARAEERPSRWGGYGHGFAGVLLGDLGGQGYGLAASTALGDGAGPSSFAGMLGGGGRARLGRYLMLGGRGFAVIAPPKQGIHGSARFLGGGGGLDAAFVAYDDDRWLVYPYLGVLGLGVELDVDSSSPAPRRIGDARIEPEARVQLESGFAMIELGAGAQRIVFGDPSGGVMVGMELGFLYSVRVSPWQIDGVEVQGLGGPSLNGGYLRLTVGGGGAHTLRRRRGS